MPDPKAASRWFSRGCWRCRKPEGVYDDGRGGWYFKATLGRDPLTGRRSQVTKRGFRDRGRAPPGPGEESSGGDAAVAAAVGVVGMTVNELLDLYLDGLDADGRLSAKTRFDYRKNAEAYVRPLLGARRLRDITPETILAWQRRLAKGGGVKKGKPLAPNTIRLARAPLAGAFKLAVSAGLVVVQPLGVDTAAGPQAVGAQALEPEEARAFLGFMEGDRTYPIWAFLLGAGSAHRRAGGAALAERRPRRAASSGSSSSRRRSATRSSRRRARAATRSAPSTSTTGSSRSCGTSASAKPRSAWPPATTSRATIVFTRPGGGPYHPQSLSRQLADLSVQAGLPRLTAHGLRHTSATLMLASGVPPKVAAERLGHADATLFTNLYSHVTPTMQREAADRIGRALFDD